MPQTRKARKGTSGWDPQHPLVVRESDPSSGRVMSLEHVAYPYPEASGAFWDANAGAEALLKFATAYLKTVVSKAMFDPELLKDLDDEKQHDRPTLKWQPLESADTARSFLVRRQVGGRTSDLSLVLLATFVEGEDVLRGGQGVRVAALLRETGIAGQFLVRFTGVISTIPRALSRPALKAFDAMVSSKWRSLFFATFGLPADSTIADIGSTLVTGLDGEGIRNLRVDVLRPYAASDVSYRFVGRFDAKKWTLQPLSREALTADIAASPFAQDPVTKTGDYATFRPSRRSAVLDRGRTANVDLGPLPVGTAADRVLLIDPVNDHVQVTNSAVVRSDPQGSPDGTKEVSRRSLKNSPSRSDVFAAVNAYHHGRDLFKRMTRFGFVPADHFKFASLPLIVRYRSGIEPGPGRDGRVINAQARWTPTINRSASLSPGAMLVVSTPTGERVIKDGSAKIVGQNIVRIVEGGQVVELENAKVLVRKTASDPPDVPVRMGLATASPQGVHVIEAPGRLEVCFALADLQSSTREAPEGSPLGVACDPRWNWHEFSHVLIAASTGELEFRFAHSAGDAMGAILFDPESALADDTRFRGVSFPWVSWPCRRHDRHVDEGWSWTGPLYHRERHFANGPLKKAYWSEQILSSSLFRLYRILGGDTRTSSGGRHQVARRAAADYVVMLMMRAIHAMGPAMVVPFLTVEQFVMALKEADASTSVFTTTTPKFRRIGGIAQKPIQWAFEQQGLRGGLPPGVDIHVDDVRHGGYAPDPLVDDSWHSTGAIHFEDDHGNVLADPLPPGLQSVNVYVDVGNRGQSASGPVSVFVHIARTTGDIPDWPEPAWKTLAGPATAASLPAGTTARIGPIVWSHPPRGRYAVLVRLECIGDPSILDVAGGLPCSSSAGPIIFTVIGDNNLGLRTVRVR